MVGRSRRSWPRPGTGSCSSRRARGTRGRTSRRTRSSPTDARCSSRTGGASRTSGRRTSPTGREAWLTSTGWNGVLVGGATNLMSGFFQRMKPIDFRLLSEFGPVEGSTVVDWPIAYEDLAPYYDRVEREIGVSGTVVDHPWADERTGPFPYPAMQEHPLAARARRDVRGHGAALRAAPAGGAAAARRTAQPVQPIGVLRVLRLHDGGEGIEPRDGDPACPRDRPLRPAVRRARRAHPQRRQGDARRRPSTSTSAVRVASVRARIFVVACQPIETARLLLNSTGPRHPNGLANGNGLVGKNLIFSTFGFGLGRLPVRDLRVEVAVDARPEVAVREPLPARLVRHRRPAARPTQGRHARLPAACIPIPSRRRSTSRSTRSLPSGAGT